MELVSKQKRESKPKRQHYIPQMLLKHFVDEDDHLSFFQKDAPERGVREQTPKTLFFKWHLYTFTDLDGNKNVSTEDFFTKLESEANPVVCKIVDNARNGKLPCLTLAERTVWDRFSFMLWKRLPDVFARLIPDCLESEDFQRQYRDCMGMAESQPIDREEMREFLWKEMWPRSLLEEDELMMDEALPTLNRMMLWVAVVPCGHPGLIVGSNPVIRIPGQTPHLNDPGTEVILAIAHDVAACFVHDHREIRYVLTPKDVRDLNRDVFNQSTIVAGRSPKQIKSLAAISKHR